VNDLDDDILWLKSTIEMNEQNFGQAIENYRKIVDQYKDGIWADDALFAIAEAYQFKLKNTELAMKAYQHLIEDFPGSLFMVEARKRYRLLRGVERIIINLQKINFKWYYTVLR
jgi:TolA-binding protein